MSLNTNPFFTVAAVAVLAFGIALSGYFVGHALLNMQRADRYVTVKGLVERDVRADTAVWIIAYSSSGNDLSAVYAQMETAQNKVTAFLDSNGFKPEDYALGQLRVTDMKSREYSSNPGADRFIIEANVTVNTNKIDTVLMASRKIGDLVRDGVLISNSGGLNFRYTLLNEIKPEMLAEATKNARQVAQQFAADSQNKVGGIRRANQGVFSITARNVDYDDANNPDKTVRVVTTVDYYLE